MVPSLLPRATVNKYGGALNFVTKMAVYQPRRAAIATIFVTVMQNDICEELLGHHKRGRTKEWIWRGDEKGMYRFSSYIPNVVVITKNNPQTWPGLVLIY